jgi:DNA-binding transcriptional ArsR family regulator
VARTSTVTRPDPLWELVLSLQMLRPQQGDALFTVWRREARAALRNARLGRIGSLLMALTPTVGYFPDFLNPSQSAQGLEYGLEAINSTPIAALGHDIGRLATHRPLSREARRLAAGEPELLTQLTAALRTCYDRTITPYRRFIDSAVDRDRGLRVDALARGGVEGLFRSLEPMVAWSHGELCIPAHRDQELRLDGRGLVLIPSYFCVTGPLTLFDPSLPPVLIYPVGRGPEDVPGLIRRGSRPLDALIGPTRAAVVEALGTRQATTTELAVRVGIAMGSASRHTRILRDSGLIASHRDRNRMLHGLTGLGRALLGYRP